jgi:addiction module HigA family antidote
MNKIEPILPGEILEEEFLKPLGISAYKLSKEINVSETSISEIINGTQKITTDTALRLSKYFGNSVEFWTGIQNEYDIRIEKENLEKQSSEIRRAGLAALKEALGPVGTVKFIQQFEIGKGDYTKEKYQQKDMTLEEIDILLKE